MDKKPLTSRDKTEIILKKLSLFNLSDSDMTQSYISQVKRALAFIQKDPYYSVIQMHYFEGMTMEEISDRLNCHIRTVRSHKRQLLDTLAAILFSDDVIREIYEE